MEDAMQNTFRTMAVRAALATTLSLAAGGALAQSTNDADPGKPLSLLQMLVHHGTPSKPEARTAAKPASKSRAHVAARATKIAARAERPAHRRTHIAARHEEPARLTEHEAAATAAAPTPAAPWPLGEMPAAGAVAGDSLAAPPNPAPAAAEPQVSELVVGGHTVQIASPDQVNAIDLAADQQAAGQPAPTAEAAGAAAKADAAATAQGDAADEADAAPESDTADAKGAAAEPDQVVAFARQADGDTDHRPSWLAELMATLGGAIAAGSVAWFLIGSAPQRRFG
jgi:hypothetical protein